MGAGAARRDVINLFDLSSGLQVADSASVLSCSTPREFEFKLSVSGIPIIAWVHARHKSMKHTCKMFSFSLSTEFDLLTARIRGRC